MMRIIAWSCENIETWLSARVDVTDKSSKFEKFRKNSKKFGNWIYLRYKPPSHPSSKRSKREKGLSIEQLLSVLFRIKVKILPLFPIALKKKLSPKCSKKNFEKFLNKFCWARERCFYHCHFCRSLLSDYLLSNNVLSTVLPHLLPQKVRLSGRSFRLGCLMKQHHINATSILYHTSSLLATFTKQQKNK